MNIHLDNGKHNLQNNSQLAQNRPSIPRASLTSNKHDSITTSPIHIIREATNEMSTTTNNNNTNYGNEILLTKESVRENSKQKLAPLNIGHRKTKSNWGEEIRQQIPDLLRQIRSK